MPLRLRPGRPGTPLSGVPGPSGGGPVPAPGNWPRPGWSICPWAPPRTGWSAPWTWKPAIRDGRRHFEPGVLARANRSILYADEVNLLDDHIVDVLLDAAAMGVNTVEREGVSFSHPARFVLVGTMNPEEGELRPQLLDRFGAVSWRWAASSSPRPGWRWCDAWKPFEADPGRLCRPANAPAEAALGERLVAARERVARVKVSDALLTDIARLAIALGSGRPPGRSGHDARGQGPGRPGRPPGRGSGRPAPGRDPGPAPSHAAQALRGRGAWDPEAVTAILGDAA